MKGTLASSRQAHLVKELTRTAGPRFPLRLAGLLLALGRVRKISKMPLVTSFVFPLFVHLAGMVPDLNMKADAVAVI